MNSFNKYWSSSSQIQYFIGTLLRHFTNLIPFLICNTFQNFLTEFTVVQKSASGEGNGNPLQYSCLENPMDRGAWWLQTMGSQKVRHNFENKPQPQKSARVSFLQMPPADYNFVKNVHAHTTWIRIIHGINFILAGVLPSLS